MPHNFMCLLWMHWIKIIILWWDLGALCTNTVTCYNQTKVDFIAEKNCQVLQEMTMEVIAFHKCAVISRQGINSLVQIMACRLIGAKPLSKPMLGYSQLNKLQWAINQNTKIFIQENALENVVWKIAAILSRPQYVKYVWVVQLENQGKGIYIKKLTFISPNNFICV